MEKELDFDELHQAVNALMDKGGKSKPKKVVPSTPVTTDPPKPVQKPEPSTDDAVTVEVKRPLPTVGTHRGNRGRAMDVVGPKAPAKITPPSAKVKRQAPTLQPTQPTVTPEPPAPRAMATPSAADHKAQEPSDDILASIDMEDQKPKESILTHAPAKSEWPDPLDVHGFADEPTPKPKKEPLVSQEAKIEQKAAEIIPLPPAEPKKEDAPEEPATPFVTTKVEKRPLGAYAEPAPAEAPSAPAQEPEAKKADPAQEPSKPPLTPQLKELSPEVIAVESAEPEFRPTPPPVPEKESDMQELRQMAIPQQYHTNDKQATQETRPVFDTKDYHPAIEAHTGHKQSHGLGWLWILIFIIVLAGTLAAAYYVMTGGFDFSALFS